MIDCYKEWQIEDMESFIERFAIFGGSEIDSSLAIEKAIVEEVLLNYRHLHYKIHSSWLYTQESQRVLIAAARGDRRIHSICKKARISEHKCSYLIDKLCEAGVLKLELSRETPSLKQHQKERLPRELREYKISHKVYFNAPFIRFWFYFIAGFETEIKDGEFTRVIERYRRDKGTYTGLIFEQICKLYMREIIYRNTTVACDSYWDRQVEIDILLNSTDRGVAVAECKYTNTKINKSTLTKLKNKCKLAKIEPQKFILFAKRGFSKELQKMPDETLTLVGIKELSSLV